MCTMIHMIIIDDDDNDNDGDDDDDLEVDEVDDLTSISGEG